MLEKRTTVLVVDDEEEIRKMLNIFLDTVDYKVVEAESGKQAIRLAASVKPDLVLLDLGLPDADGMDILGRALDPNFQQFAASLYSIWISSFRGFHQSLIVFTRELRVDREQHLSLDVPLAG